MFSEILAFIESFGLVYGCILLCFLYSLWWFVTEKIYYIPDISGTWDMELLYKETEYNPYRNMQVMYKIFIKQNKSIINAKAEKFFEKLNNGTSKHYTSEEKTSSTYEGTIKRGFLNHKLELLLEEEGMKRKVVGTFDLVVVSPGSGIRGKFERRDANSSGNITLKR